MPKEEIEFINLDDDHRGSVLGKFSSYCYQLKNKLGVTPSNDSDRFVDINITEEGLEVESPPGSMFQFTGIPYPSDNDTANGQKLHIGAVFQQTILGRETENGVAYEATKSTIRVVYLKVTSSRNKDTGKYPAKIKHGYRFDFEFDAKEDHPIFHTQYDPETIDLDILEQKYEIKNAEVVEAEVLDTPRVPSAPMDIAGLTYMLTKELPEDVEWPGELTSNLEKLPKYPNECYRPTPQDGTHMLPEWWYVHGSEHNTLAAETVRLRTADSLSN